MVGRQGATNRVDRAGARRILTGSPGVTAMPVAPARMSRDDDAVAVNPGEAASKAEMVRAAGAEPKNPWVPLAAVVIDRTAPAPPPAGIPPALTSSAAAAVPERLARPTTGEVVTERVAGSEPLSCGDPVAEEDTDRTAPAVAMTGRAGVVISSCAGVVPENAGDPLAAVVTEREAVGPTVIAGDPAAWAEIVTVAAAVPDRFGEPAPDAVMVRATWRESADAGMAVVMARAALGAMATFGDPVAEAAIDRTAGPDPDNCGDPVSDATTDSNAGVEPDKAGEPVADAATVRAAAGEIEGVRVPAATVRLAESVPDGLGDPAADAVTDKAAGSDPESWGEPLPVADTDSEADGLMAMAGVPDTVPVTTEREAEGLMLGANAPAATVRVAAAVPDRAGAPVAAARTARDTAAVPDN